MRTPLTEFENILHDAGLVPGEVIPDGVLHRCGTSEKPACKNGWYIFYEDYPASGSFGNWRTGLIETWTAKNEKSLTKVERQALKARIERDKAAREEETAKRHAEARKKAQSILNACLPAPTNHPYLVRKGVTVDGLRISKDGRLVVPVYDEIGVVMSVQFISPDGSKRFLTGGKIAGGFIALKGGTGPLHIAEGIATAATIHTATGETVLAAFNAGNLEAVAVMAREKYPDREIILCADDDRETEGNPGLTKATEAARKVNGFVAAPLFANQAAGTDFNDMAASQGLEAVKAQLAEAQPPKESGQVNAFPKGFVESKGPEKSVRIPQDGPGNLLPFAPESESWRLARDLFPRVPFPWEALPLTIASSLKQLARSCATSATPLPAQAICLMAAALGRKVDVVAKASWREPLVFWACDIRDSGAGKTAPMWEMANELTKRQASEHERFKDEQDEWAKMSPKDRQGMIPPRSPRGYFTTNLTLEGIHSDLDGHESGGLAVLLSELSALISGQNQYRAKGGTDRESWLCLHDGKPARVTRARGSVFIQGARVQVCGGIQPGIFRQVFGGAGGQYIEDGTVFRCLFTFESSMHHELTSESWTDEYREAWASMLGMALDWADGQQEPHLLTLTSDAQERFFEWRNALDVQRADLPPTFRGFLPKAYGYALRIAGTLHAMEQFSTGRNPGNVLSLEEIERAILVVHFYLGQAVDALQLLLGDGEGAAPAEVSSRTILLAQVLEGSRSQVDNGRLAVGFIKEAYNATAKPEERLSPHAMGALLRSCGLTVSNGKHNANGRRCVSCLQWDERTDLFLKQSLHSLTYLPSKEQCGLAEAELDPPESDLSAWNEMTDGPTADKSDYADMKSAAGNPHEYRGSRQVRQSRFPFGDITDRTAAEVCQERGPSVPTNSHGELWNGPAEVEI
ncbi:DUF3987 domain-containing protein [Desulfovibrio inopinatus]|uniref:DUF3987 domain-containing protein n=1 Tax=Desulfovibrio inopinatus TaxID=102109 RepID=UPI00041D3CB3|nr:DUF3987 domain-containing protein [Desulfovibrio inopinatus]